jgi:hypothetical protein
MKKVSIDIETFSETDLQRRVVYRYAEDPAFEILPLAWRGRWAVKVYDLTAGGRYQRKYWLLCRMGRWKMGI